MSDKNIDKDIEEFKQELIYSIKCIQEGTSCDEGFRYTCFGEGDIEQVLKIIEELETYKKIAEKLVDTIFEMDTEEKDVYETICKSIPHNICDEFEDGRCDKCIIDWARKEVEKE